MRRLVSGASVFDNAEKGRIVHRVLVGLGAAGVERVLLTPDNGGILESLRRSVRAGTHGTSPLPDIELIPLPLRGTAEDTLLAVETMVARAVSAIVVLGGDGTHRVVSMRCGETPLCALSTGTNNAFPRHREATGAGLATGLLACRKVDPTRCVRREKRLEVRFSDGAVLQAALVDVAIATTPWIGARALWRARDVSDVFVSLADPGGVGLSALAGMIEPIPRAAPYGLYIQVVDPVDAPRVVNAPLAPGLVVPVGVAHAERLNPGQSIVVSSGGGSLAFDGERDVECPTGQNISVTISPDGPFTIDVDAALSSAARAGVLIVNRSRSVGSGEGVSGSGAAVTVADHPAV